MNLLYEPYSRNGRFYTPGRGPGQIVYSAYRLLGIDTKTIQKK